MRITPVLSCWSTVEKLNLATCQERSKWMTNVSLLKWFQMYKRCGFALLGISIYLQRLLDNSYIRQMFSLDCLFVEHSVFYEQRTHNIVTIVSWTYLVFCAPSSIIELYFRVQRERALARL